jgi:predicted lipoprotein with Yx(FWY)xxD motif
MRAAMKFLIPTLAASVLLAACGGSSKSSTSPGRSAPTTTVKSAANAKLGSTVLVDAQGLTLYRLSGEGNGHFICTGSCLSTWHPLTVNANASPTGVGSLGTVKRPDGATQVTYKGMPLYTFTQDSAPGDANGQGFKDVGTWNAVTTGASSNGTAPKSTPSGSGAAAPAPSGGGGYGY